MSLLIRLEPCSILSTKTGSPMMAAALLTSRQVSSNLWIHLTMVPRTTLKIVHCEYKPECAKYIECIQHRLTSHHVPCVSQSGQNSKTSFIHEIVYLMLHRNNIHTDYIATEFVIKLDYTLRCLINDPLLINFLIFFQPPGPY